MRILFLTSAHNSLSQRAWIELTERGHEVRVALAHSDDAMLAAVVDARPELIIAPMLTRAIPESIWRRHLCLVVHPGPPGDRGPSSLDWAILENAPRWGVTVLQAGAELDGGPIWATRSFATRPAGKSSIYRNEVIPAAIDALLEIVANFERGCFRRERLDYASPEVWGRPRPRIRQCDRVIDWAASTDSVLRVLRSADGAPGVLDRIGDLNVVLFGGVAEGRLRGEPGALLATRDGAICRATGDGAVWIPSLRRRHTPERRYAKLPATAVLGPRLLAGVPQLPLPIRSRADGATYRQIRYDERGTVGLLRWDVPQGALSTALCRRLVQAVQYAARRPTRVLVLMGGPDYFCNGIHLGTIEAADDPAVESWRNINAIDDLVGELIRLDHKLVVAALEGNAGAGGAILPLAADQVWLTPEVVLNPHYAGMGGLYGSEYWTYLLPRRVGAPLARELTQRCDPLGPARAQRIGLVDAVLDVPAMVFVDAVAERAAALASRDDYTALVAGKRAQRAADERSKPLAAYRAAELAEMKRCFFGPDRSYHEARRRFVYKAAPALALAAA